MATAAEGRPVSAGNSSQQHVSWLLADPRAEGSTGDYLSDPTARPPFDYATLCAKAIMSCPDERGTLRDLYAYIRGNFPYYARSWACWQNSLRHTLSHHKCFERVEGPGRLGRSKPCRYWCIAQDQRHLFSDDGVYLATSSHRRSRSIKDVSEQFRRSGKRAVRRPCCSSLASPADEDLSLQQAPPKRDASAGATCSTNPDAVSLHWPSLDLAPQCNLPADSLDTKMFATNSPNSQPPSKPHSDADSASSHTTPSPATNAVNSAATNRKPPPLISDVELTDLVQFSNELDWDIVAGLLGLE